jgi:hypothetical protein
MRDYWGGAGVAGFGFDWIPPDERLGCCVVHGQADS